MEKKEEIKDTIKWYSDMKPIFEQLSKKVENIIQEIICDKKIAIHSIYSRSKEIKSFSKKIEDKKYTDPKFQITDCAGIRIITYVESDLDLISDILKLNFDVDEPNSIDKSKFLGVDKVGYRSIHFICKLPKDRIKLAEYKKYEGLSFEIQIRTILQHAWAEIEHDRNYKFSGVLPDYLKRRFKVLAGVLELADREFNEIAKEIDKYSVLVKESTSKKEYNVLIDSISIREYSEVKFKKFIEQGLEISFSPFDRERSEKQILLELKDFGINTLEELDNIILSDFIKKASDNKIFKTEDKEMPNNMTGLLRSIMMINNAEKYFENSWKNSWRGIDEKTSNFIKQYYNSKFDKIIEKYGIQKMKY